jgi:hypothetical protein
MAQSIHVLIPEEFQPVSIFRKWQCGKRYTVKDCNRAIARELNIFNVGMKIWGMRPLERPRRRWEDNSIMDLREIGRQVVDWMHLALDRDQGWVVVNTVISYWVP